MAGRWPSPGTSDLSVPACPEDRGGRTLLPPTRGHCCARWTPQSFPLVDQKGAGTSKAHSPAPRVPAAGWEGPRCPSGWATVSSSRWGQRGTAAWGPVLPATAGKDSGLLASGLVWQARRVARCSLWAPPTWPARCPPAPRARQQHW